MNMVAKNEDGFDKLTNRKINWMMHYNELKAYVAVHHHLPECHQSKCPTLNVISSWSGIVILFGVFLNHATMRLGFLVVVDAHKEQIVGVFKDLARVFLALNL